MEGEQNAQQNQPGTAGQPPQQPQQNSGDNTMLMGILSYLGPLVLIPFFTDAKNIPFVKFHIKQGFVLLVIEAILWVLGMMVWGLWFIIPIINVALIILSILGIVNVVNKKEAELPVVGQFAKHFNF